MTARFHERAAASGRYLAVLAVGNLAWEIGQMPLYTLWRTGSTREIAFAVIHCTGGDMLIGGTALLGSLLLLGASDWPRSGVLPVGGMAIGLGLGYTIYSEHLNTLRNTWTYSDLMPILPGLGTGLAPLAQWMVVPVLAFTVVCWPLRQRTAACRVTPGP